VTELRGHLLTQRSLQNAEVNRQEEHLSGSVHWAIHGDEAIPAALVDLLAIPASWMHPPVACRVLVCTHCPGSHWAIEHIPALGDTKAVLLCSRRKSLLVRTSWRFMISIGARQLHFFDANVSPAVIVFI
jgi:hypothetical protein